MKKRKKGRQPPRNRVVEIFYSHRDPRAAITLLKTDSSYRVAQKILPKLGNLGKHDQLRVTLLGAVKPETWSEIIQPQTMPPSRDWIEEIGWLTHGFIHESDTLNVFNRIRAEFGKAYLLGDYSAANESLNEARTQLGCSVWLAERKLMLLQVSEGFAKQKTYVSKLQSESKDALTAYILTAISDRLEMHVTPDVYMPAIANVIQDFEERFSREFSSWVSIHVDPWSFRWIHDVHEVLARSTGKTLVDRYDRTLKILSCLSLETLTESDRVRLSAMLSDLKEVVSDRQLQQVHDSLESRPSPFEPITDDYLSAVDSLLAREYSIAEKVAHRLIMQNPTCFQFYWLLATSLVCSGKSPAKIFTTECIASNILVLLCAVLRNDGAMTAHLTAISNIALKLGDNHLGVSLWQFCQYEENHEISPFARNQMHAQNKIGVGNPLFGQNPVASQYSKDPDRDVYGAHPCLRLQDVARGSEEAFSGVSEILSEPFLSLLSAWYYEKHGDSKVALDLVAEIQTNGFLTRDEHVFHHSLIAEIEFRCLVQLNRPCDAASEVVKNYLYNSNVLRHIPFEALVDGGQRGRWEILKESVLWPILVFLNNGDPQDIYEALDDALGNQACDSPYSIINGLVECTVDQRRVLLRDVIIPEVISRGALWYKTAEDRRKMRRECLKQLFSVSVEEQSFAVNELSRLEQEELLEEAYKSMEGPKFSLDYTEINEALADVFRDVFKRFQAHQEYEHEGGSLVSNEELLKRATGGDLSSVTEAQSTETSGLLLLPMATDAFRAYLLNPDAGISGALNTRIRHGSLENQLRRTLGFESFRSDDQRGSGNAELEKRSGDAIEVLAGANLVEIDKCFAKFSTRISDVLRDLIDDKLRVRLPVGEVKTAEGVGFRATDIRVDSGLLDFGALFDGGLSDRVRGCRASSTLGFLKEVEGIFVEQANVAFGAVRAYLQHEFALVVSEALADLEVDVGGLLKKDSARIAFRRQIEFAKQGFFQDLSIVQHWFAGAGQNRVGVQSLRDVLGLAARVVNYASNGKLGRLNVESVENREFPELIGALMYEIVSILFRNVVQHSEVEDGQEVVCSHIAEDGIGKLVVQNKIASKKRCRELVERARGVIQRPFDNWVLGEPPGRTGYSRVRKLLRQAGYNDVEMNVVDVDDGMKFEVEIKIHYEDSRG